MESIIFGLFAIIVMVVFLNLSDGAFQVNASMNDRYDQIEDVLK